jgi:LmbE family N-acetylglucosaminyl deacetylase
MQRSARAGHARPARRAALGAAAALALACGGSPPAPPVAPTRFEPAVRERVLVVVAPHPDDETIMAGATLYRAARDPLTSVRAVYLSSGDATGRSGRCREESVEARRRKVVRLRESEALAAWEVIGVDPTAIQFLRHPDTKLVARSRLSGGRRVDELSEAGAEAVREVEALLPGLVPDSARELLVITASRWDAHGDHRTAYRAARAGAERVRSARGIPVVLLSAIVHDEFRFQLPFCCLGDAFWPRSGPQDDHAALVDTRARPRPPAWDVAWDASDLVAVRREALRRHASQVEGHEELCITFPTVATSFMEHWMEKAQEVFYREEL